MQQFHATPYERRHREALFDLLFYSRRTHYHLEWYDVGKWLDMPDVTVQLAWQGESLVGVMAVSAVLHGACWIRLLAVQNSIAMISVLTVLWDSLVEVLRAAGVLQVGVLVLNDWLGQDMRHLGFHYIEDVVTMRRTGYKMPPPRDFSVDIRSAVLEELPVITAVDQQAFAPPWQMTDRDLHFARRHAASFTVALLDDHIVGYQLSTRQHNKAHLARLAVLPNLQGKGVGAALVDHMIRTLLKRGIETISVNTQASNERSQRLYRRYGFYRTGYDLPVWLARL